MLSPSDDAVFVSPRANRSVPAQAVIQHWQLRDLVVTSPGLHESELLFVSYSSVGLCNLQNPAASKMLLRDIPFQPICIAANQRYLAVGGQRAQVLVRELNGGWSASIGVGGSTNNALAFFSSGGSETRLLVCNNDKSIKVYTMPLMQRVAVISIPSPVNHVSISPDGRFFVATGDCKRVFLYSIHSNTYQLHSEIPVHGSTSGFGTSWHHSSEIFAVASEAGFVTVFDVRRNTPMVQYSAVNVRRRDSGGAGAIRSVKFTNDGTIDLLAFAEHETHVHLVDARTFNSRQILRATTSLNDHSISGIAFSNSSRRLYVGRCEEIAEFEIDVRRRRSFPNGQLI